MTLDERIQKHGTQRVYLHLAEIQEITGFGRNTILRHQAKFGLRKRSGKWVARADHVFHYMETGKGVK